MNRSYFTTDVCPSSCCTIPEKEKTDAKANNGKCHKGHTHNYDGDSENKYFKFFKGQ